jgi:CheY-like chemotaxis protein
MGDVLVVEDDPDLLAALAGALEEEGFGVSRARHGLEALGQLRSGRRPCVILLDLMMPIMNGWQFRHEQRQDRELARIPVVVVSAKTDSAQHAAWLEADAYLEKPLSLGRLLEVVNRFCGGEKEGREDPERPERPEISP